MKQKEYFELFKLFETDPTGFAIKVFEIKPDPKDADFIMLCMMNDKMTEVERCAAVAIALVHFRDKVKVTVDGPRSPKLEAECEALKREMTERIMRRN